jgi:hypothetical protein
VRLLNAAIAKSTTDPDMARQLRKVKELLADPDSLHVLKDASIRRLSLDTGTRNYIENVLQTPIKSAHTRTATAHWKRLRVNVAVYNAVKSAGRPDSAGAAAAAAAARRARENNYAILDPPDGASLSGSPTAEATVGSPTASLGSRASAAETVEDDFDSDDSSSSSSDEQSAAVTATASASASANSGQRPQRGSGSKQHRSSRAGSSRSSRGAAGGHPPPTSPGGTLQGESTAHACCVLLLLLLPLLLVVVYCTMCYGDMQTRDCVKLLSSYVALLRCIA